MRKNRLYPRRIARPSAALIFADRAMPFGGTVPDPPVCFRHDDD
jgi:hypothetical protein